MKGLEMERIKALAMLLIGFSATLGSIVLGTLAYEIHVHGTIHMTRFQMNYEVFFTATAFIWAVCGLIIIKNGIKKI